MSKKSKKNLEKRSKSIWKFFEDGIWDIFLGMLIIWLGLMMFYRWSGWFTLVLIVFPIIPFVLKKSFTLPRVDQIKQKPKKRRAIIEIGLIVFAIIVILLLIVKKEPGLAGVFSYIKENGILVLGAVLGTLTWYVAYALGFQRLYFYGLLIFVGFFFEFWLTTEKTFSFSVFSGIIILLSGSYLLIQFLKAAPEKR
jgi:hypothetical protein